MGAAKLTVIIVNYNVKYFLEQCLLSVRKAAATMQKVPADDMIAEGEGEVEVIVVDNNSVDGSVEMLQGKFPEVKLIANKENAGFSTANNQAIKESTGQYVLLLNPDTVVSEDTFSRIVDFMDAHQDAGGLGVKMMDGKGIFLPESKRAFPSPWVAFTKMIGLARLFPSSKTFGQYHLGYLPEDEVNKVDVLSGAFMLLRKEALDKVGLLDEDFFMYGEDIDLSYRLVKGGYTNYYFPEARIIHYKGESTKKGSMNYLRMFYNAMIIFARKHLSQGSARTFIIFIKLAIYLRAGVSLASRWFGKLASPGIDALLIYGGMYLLSDFWGSNIKGAISYYPQEYLYFNVPLYVLIWIASIFLSGGYDKPARSYRVVRGLIAGTILIAAVYGFLPEEFRFSRAMIVVGAALSIFLLVASRGFVNLVQTGNFGLDRTRDNKLVVVGNREETARVLAMLNQVNARITYVGYLSNEELPGNEHLGRIDQLPEVAGIYQVDEVIFCSTDVSSGNIMELMTRIGPAINYKIVPEESQSIIGSNSKDSAGDLYAFDINLDLATSMGRRNKRIFDLMTCVGLTVSLPVIIWGMKRPLGLLVNLFRVAVGNMTWVGYVDQAGGLDQLPPLRRGVLHPTDRELDGGVLQRLNFLYAKDYSASTDLRIVWRSFRELGNANQSK